MDLDDFLELAQEYRAMGAAITEQLESINDLGSDLALSKVAKDAVSHYIIPFLELAQERGVDIGTMLEDSETVLERIDEEEEQQ